MPRKTLLPRTAGLLALGLGAMALGGCSLFQPNPPASEVSYNTQPNLGTYPSTTLGAPPAAVGATPYGLNEPAIATPAAAPVTTVTTPTTTPEVTTPPVMVVPRAARH